MYATLRYQNNKDYWTKRWTAIPADEAMQNKDAYPLKYALMTVHSPEEKTLEAGCGNGRVVRHFKENGRHIIGMDFIAEAIDKLKEADPELDVETGDITNLRYEDASFDNILAFGLYHNLQGEMLERAMSETVRVMKPGGRLCASFRADNWANRINDWHANYKARKNSGDDITKDSPKEFHKLNLTEKEFEGLVTRHGLQTLKLMYVVNMPFLYKFRLFRKNEHKDFNESKGRREGYLLSPFGGWLQRCLMRYLPSKFCNIYVIIAEKANA